jgi:hypothetical protein
VEEDRLSPEDIRGLGEDGLGETILAGLVHPVGLLSYLRDHGVSADQLRDAAEGARTAEKYRGQIASPDTGDGNVTQAAHSATRLIRLSRVLERLADELASGRPGPAYSLLADGNGLIAQGRRPWVFDDQRPLLLDGTANPEILRQFVPHLQDLPEIRVQRKARVIQVRDLTFFRHSLVERAPAGEGRGEVAAHCAARGGRRVHCSGGPRGTHAGGDEQASTLRSHWGEPGRKAASERPVRRCRHRSCRQHPRDERV